MMMIGKTNKSNEGSIFLIFPFEGKEYPKQIEISFLF